MQFGVTVRAVAGRQEFLQFVRRADELGYDVLAAPDHLGAPVTLLCVGRRRRPQRAPALPDLRPERGNLEPGTFSPARSPPSRRSPTVASSSGWGRVKSEHDDAGLPWPRLDERVARLERMVRQLRRRVGAGVPLLIGAMSRQGQQILDTPFALVARDAAHAAEELRPNIEALGEVMAAYRRKVDPL